MYTTTWDEKPELKSPTDEKSELRALKFGFYHLSWYCRLATVRSFLSSILSISPSSFALTKGYKPSKHQVLFVLLPELKFPTDEKSELRALKFGFYHLSWYCRLATVRSFLSSILSISPSSFALTKGYKPSKYQLLIETHT